jgi:hypothetical protein
MTISNLIERGNPEDMDEEMMDGTQPTSVSSSQLAKNKAVSSRNTLIILILVLTSSASFGLGILVGQSSAVSSSGGILVGSVPSGKSDSSALLIPSATETSPNLQKIATSTK